MYIEFCGEMYIANTSFDYISQCHFCVFLWQKVELLFVKKKKALSFMNIQSGVQ